MKRISRLLVLCLLAGSSPISALSQESATGPRRRTFDEFMNFNRLVRNWAVTPIWSAADDSFRFTQDGVVGPVGGNVPPAGRGRSR